MGTGSFVVSNACLISTNIDPTAVRYLVAHGVDRATAMRIVERATDEWQHGNTVITPMRVAMDHVGARLRRTDTTAPPSSSGHTPSTTESPGRQGPGRRVRSPGVVHHGSVHLDLADHGGRLGDLDLGGDDGSDGDFGAPRTPPADAPLAPTAARAG